MTDWSVQIVGGNYRELQRDNNLGEVVQALVRKRYGKDAAKKIEARWDIDPRTARNLVSAGNCSERTLAKAIQAEGWDLILALGHALTGQTHHEWEEQKYQSIIEEAENALERVHRLRTRRALLDESAEAADEAVRRTREDPKSPQAQRPRRSHA